MSATITFKGIELVKSNLSLADKRVKNAVKSALEEAGGNLLAEAVKIVPHDIGTLQDSGAKGEVTKKGGEMQIAVGFNTPYAARLHEHPEYKFQKGRKGKYLETPLKQNEGKYIKTINNQVKASLEGKL